MSECIRAYAATELPFTPYATAWAPSSSKLAIVGGQGPVASSVGKIRIAHCFAGKINTLIDVEGPCPFRCVSFVEGRSLSHRLMCTGNFFGRVSVWDMSDMQSPLLSIEAHKEIINALVPVRQGGPEIVSASRDGECRLWDLRSSEKAAVLINPDGKSNCWSVADGPAGSNCIAAGYENGSVHIYDLRSCLSVHKFDLKEGVASLEHLSMQNGESSLLVTTSSSSVALIDWQAEKKANARELTLKHKTSQSRQPITVWCGRRTHKKGRYITANQSGQVILYDDTLKVLSTESAGEHPILSVDCHPQREGLLATCSLDKQVRVLSISSSH